MNITVDDTSSNLQWSSGNWKTQGSSDPLAVYYFGQSFHVTQEDGASIMVTFQGNALYIYGSTGPGHANFSVRWANNVEPLSALGTTFEPQQLLWSRIFTDQDGLPPYEVLLTSVTNGANTWLDIDYLTIETPSNSTTTALGSYQTTNAALLSSLATSTAQPDGLLSSISSTDSSPSSVATSSQTPPASHPIGTLIATVILSCLFALTLIGLCIYKFLRQRKKLREAKERNFRWGLPYFQAPVSSTPTEALQISTGDTLPRDRMSPDPTSDISLLSRLRDPLLQTREPRTAAVMGWSMRNGDASVVARAGTPNSVSKPPLSIGTNLDQQLVARDPSFISPPSYRPSPHPYHRTQDVESNNSPSPQLPEPVPARPIFPPVEPLRPKQKRPSAAAAANIFKLQPTVRAKPKRPPREGPLAEMVLYDDGDSRKTNFLQV